MVVAGSHGKTTVTSMVLHALQGAGMQTDLMVGAQLDGFERMVDLDDRHDWAVIEGDEYLSSPIDRKPKFLWYGPHVTILTGIAWDHVNVFPTEENYVSQFSAYLRTVQPEGVVVYCEEDPKVRAVVAEVRPERPDVSWISYHTPEHRPTPEGSEVRWGIDFLKMKLLGAHNMQNLAAARQACHAMGLSHDTFDLNMASFTGAARRLEVAEEDQEHAFTAFRDFAHAPSKLRATQASVVGQFPERNVTAIFELHTFSSLNRTFLPQYEAAMDAADHAVVFFDPAVVAHKHLPELNASFVKSCFGREDLEVLTSTKALEARLNHVPRQNHVLLLMSSGRFGGANLSRARRQETS
jgi:UDP-N-acetylmuramate: L-alanyl-gamma-D-glutamyl-meso-diaminopimelate ligase